MKTLTKYQRAKLRAQRDEFLYQADYCENCAEEIQRTLDADLASKKRKHKTKKP